MKRDQHTSPIQAQRNDYKILKILLFTITLAALQAVALAPRDAMGQDVSQLTGGLLQLFPFHISFQIIKIIAFITTLIWASSYHQRLSFTLLLRSLISWALITLGALLSYPALFEDTIPTSLKEAISTYGTSTYPILFTIIGWSIWLGPSTALFYNRHQQMTWAILLSALVCSDSHTEKNQDLILLISIDSLRPDTIQPGVSAELAQFKNNYTSFEQHFVGIPRTFPSWVETLEGRPAALSGIRHMFPNQPERQHQSKNQTFIKSLRDNGYYTTLISDFAGDIFPRFKTHFHTVNAPTFTLPSMLQLNITTHLRGFLPYIITPPFRGLFPEIEASPISTDPLRLIELAKNEIKNNQRKNAITLFFSTAHFPYASPWPFYPTHTTATHSYFQKNPDLSYNQLSSDEKEHIIRLYQSSIRAIDSACAELFEYLKSEQLWDKSTIVITADHGEELFDAGRIQGHGEHLWGQTMTQVPLLWKIPNHTRHREIKSITRSIDLGATLLGSLDSTNTSKGSTPQFLGQDLSPWLQEKALSDFPLLPAFSETGLWFSNKGKAVFQDKRIWYPNINELITIDPISNTEVILHQDYKNIAITAKHRSLIKQDFKILYLPTATHIEWELYNWKKDPHNLSNLALKNPKKLNDLKAELLAYIRKIENQSHIINNYVVPL